VTVREVTPNAQQLAQRFEQLVDLAPDGIMVHDGETVLSANAAVLRLVGATNRSDLVGERIDRFFRSPHLKAIEEVLIGANRTTDPSPPTRDTLYRLDGSTVAVEVRAALYLEATEPRVALVIRDITERLALERLEREVSSRLQAAQRLDAVGVIAGGVAHEVNNMMQVVLGMAALLRESIPAGDPHSADLREIIRAAEHTGSITRQLLAFSRHALHRPVAVQLDTLLLALTPMLHRLVGVARHLMLAIGATPTVMLDIGQLEQVLVNLLLNARQATQDGGLITLTTKYVQGTVDSCTVNPTPIPSGSYVLISVQDNGIGMDAETRARVFEPFFTTKPIGEGTGLGLSAVQGIMAQHGGYVCVASTLGLGTTVTTVWPADAASVAEPAPVPRAAPSTIASDAPLRGMTILVVDDEDVVRMVVARMLSRAGATVQVAVNGAEALEHLQTHGAPSLVITDVVMPVMGGLELVQRLGERWPDVPVLVMSGYPAAPTDTSADISHTAIDLPKPFSMSLMLERVAEKVRARRDTTTR
jgi:two-component system cell cycle sensor histidine kinase/response regulator CckA